MASHWVPTNHYEEAVLAHQNHLHNSEAVLAHCPVCNKLFRRNSFEVTLIQSIKAHLSAKSRRCSLHKAFHQCTVAQPHNLTCPAPGCTLIFSSMASAWAHFTHASDEAHERCKGVYIERSTMRDPNSPESLAAAKRMKERILYASAKENAHVTVQRLLEEGVNPNSGGEDGFTPLMTACEAGHVEIVHLLINAQCTVNKQNNYSQTALTLAAQNGQREVVSLLLDCPGGNDGKVNLTLLGNSGLTAAQIARRAGHGHIADAIARRDKERQVAELMRALTSQTDGVLCQTYDSMGERLSAIFAATGTEQNKGLGANEIDDEYTLEAYEASLCIVCVCTKVDVVLLPCWHAQYCSHCAKHLNECAICRVTIEEKKRIFLP